MVAEDEQCVRCNGQNAVWAAPSPLWNKVMRGNDINGDTIFGDLVCVKCFIELAEKTGITGRWRLDIDPRPDDLVYVTPSGRVWDEQEWLWIDEDDTEAKAPSTGTASDLP